MRLVLFLLSLSLWALLPTRAQTAQQLKAAARIYFDPAHGEATVRATTKRIDSRGLLSLFALSCPSGTSATEAVSNLRI
jgi:hypothetical protein